jgi:ubiquinone/menaquinone biosynthesis C-methylase UbiE
VSGYVASSTRLSSKPRHEIRQALGMPSPAEFMTDVRRFAITLLSLVRPADNASAYLSLDAVNPLSEDDQLQPAESAVLEELRDWLPDRKMLDLGVGGGRTTVSFSPIVGEYVAVDFSEPMIRACQERFRSSPTGLRFITMDARDLSPFKDAYFDFILFSYNGLDTVDHDDRLRSISEISRVLKPGGYFCFSTHNIRSIDQLYSLNEEQRRSLYTKLRGIVSQIVIRILNPPRSNLKVAQHAIIRDGALEFRLQHYYIDPAEQIDQLRSFGFTSTILYGSSGKVISFDTADQCEDPWIYYLAQLPK